MCRIESLLCHVLIFIEFLSEKSGMGSGLPWWRADPGLLSRPLTEMLKGKEVKWEPRAGGELLDSRSVQEATERIQVSCRSLER